MKNFSLSYHDKQVFIVLNILAILTFVYDTFFSDVRDCLQNTKTNSCKLAIIIINFVHHYMSIFGLFGWLFDNKILLFIYISLVIITVLQWKLTGGVCIVTKCISILSDTPEYRRFNDLYRIMNLRKLIKPKILYYGSLSAFVAVAIYKLFIL